MPLVAILGFVCVSPAMLQLIGWHYDGAGSVIQNVHPGTYLLILWFFGTCLTNGKYLQSCLTEMSNNVGLVSFAVTSAAATIYAVVIQHCSIMPFVETFGMTILTFLVLRRSPTPPMSFFRWSIDIFMVANIAIILVEYLLKKNLIAVYHYSPVAVQASAPAGFDRPTGFFGLPLLAASFLCIYAIANVIRQLRTDSASHIRSFIGGGALLAATLTGSRTAVITAVALILLLFIFSSGRMLVAGNGQRAERRALFWWGVMGLLALPLALQLGLFDLLLNRFQDDHGSSSTRDIALNILMSMSPYDLLLGSGPDTIWVQQQIYGLIAIEISWVNFIIVCGLLFSIPLFLGYCQFLFSSLPRACRMGYAPALFFLIVQAASIGLWAKSTSFAGEIAILLAYAGKPIAEARKLHSLPYVFEPAQGQRTAGMLSMRFRTSGPGPDGGEHDGC